MIKRTALKMKKAFSCLLLVVLITGCSSDNDLDQGSNLIKIYGLEGPFTFQVSPLLMGSIPVTSGQINGTIREEDGALRLRFKRFNASPMPFDMTVDAQFTVEESSKGLEVKNVKGKSFFDADPPKESSTIDEGKLPVDIGLSEDQKANGIHSYGNSVISGTIRVRDGMPVYSLKLDPGVGLPVVVNIVTVKRLN